MLEDFLSLVTLEARVVPDRVRLTPLQLFQSTTYPVLAQIPVDVWLLIFDAGNFAPYHLEQISLTCRWFRALCIPRLYSSIIITRDKPAPGREQELWDTIATGPDALSSLRQSSRAEKFRGLKEAKHILPYIRRLEFRHYPLSPIPQHIPWIRSEKPFQSRPVLVFLQQNWKEVFLDVAEALPEMVALEHLSLCYLDIPSRVSQGLKSLPSLRIVELIKCKLECTDWPRLPEIRITVPNTHHVDIPAYSIIDSTIVRSLDLPIAPKVSESCMPAFTHLTSLTVPMITLEHPLLLNALREFLVATPSIQHLSLLGGLYQLRRPNSHRCYQHPKLELPPSALPNLCRIEGFCRIIDDLVPGRTVTDVNLWCWGSLEGRIERSYQIFKTSRAQSGVEKLALNFPYAYPLNYSSLADVAPSLRSLEINYNSSPNLSTIIPKLTPLLPQLARLHTLILRPTTVDLQPCASEGPHLPKAKAKMKQARKFLFELVPTASPTLSTIILSLRTGMEMVLYRTEPPPTRKATAKKQKNNEYAVWEVVAIGWDKSIGDFVPDVRLYNERAQRVPGEVGKIRVSWEKESLAAPAT